VSVEHRPWAGGRCAVVVLSGDADVTGKVLEEVLAAEADKDPALLLVDLSAVSFMDSWSLHVVLRAMRGRQKAGAAAGLVCPSGPVRRVLELTGAGQLVPVFASMTEAMRVPGLPG
jgi:anti-sigma B factor antagonist